MSRDIFSKDFKPYVQYTKGFYIYDYHKKQKVYIKGHYSYIDKGIVIPIDFRKKEDRSLFNRAKKRGRVFYGK